jgi:hypothetical protein
MPDKIYREQSAEILFCDEFKKKQFEMPPCKENGLTYGQFLMMFASGLAIGFVAGSK